ncbi:hypothetical protein M8J75_009565 [Diaphorina citri]|nr:hypothetical protein M8J75_009565 [Diaphorina citri]
MSEEQTQVENDVTTDPVGPNDDTDVDPSVDPGLENTTNVNAEEVDNPDLVGDGINLVGNDVLGEEPVSLYDFVGEEEGGKEEEDRRGKEENDENFEDFSAMTIEQLDSFLHENEEAEEEEDNYEDEEDSDECEEETENPSSNEDTSGHSDRVLGHTESTGEQMERIMKQKEMSEKRIEELKEKLEEKRDTKEKINKEHAEWKRKHGEEKDRMDGIEKNYQTLLLRTENLSRTAQQLETLEMKRQSELSIARIQSAKSSKEIENLLSNDLKQDILSLMINREINKLERSLAECEEQCQAKHIEMKAMLGRLGDARADLASMEKENKKIDEAWNKIVTSINVKQKEYLDVQDEARIVREKLRELEIATANTKKLWTTEKYNGEKITAELLRFIDDFNKYNRAVRRRQTAKYQMERQIITLNKIIGRNKMHIDEFARLETRMSKELKMLTASCDALAMNILQVENDILEKYQTDFVCNNKGMMAVSEEIRTLKRLNRNAELEIKNLEYKLTAIVLESDKLRSGNKKKESELRIMLKEIGAKIRHVETIEKKVERVKKQIGVKSVKIEQDSRKLETLTQDLEQNSKTPKEKLIDNLNFDIGELCSNLKQIKNQWLRKQTKLIGLIEEHNGNLRDINELECRSHEYEYKLNKQNRCIEEYCQKQEKLKTTIDRLVKGIDREMEKFVHTKDFEAALNEENALRQNMYYDQLQDAEKELYNLKASIEQLEAEEKCLLRSIESAESDYLSWDKKCTLAAKEKEKYEMEKKPGGEIEQLKREIHRMEMRYAQLKNVQKKLMNDLEACVTRRERIMDNVRARAKRNTKEDTKKYIHVKKVQQLKNQVKQVQAEIKALEQLSEEYKTRKEDLINENTNKQNQLKSLQENIEKIERQLQEGYLHKQKNLEILIRKQRRCRHYCQLKDGKYRPMFRTESSLELETIKQTDSNQNLISLVETLIGDFPSLEYSFKKVLNTLKLNELITH